MLAIVIITFFALLILGVPIFIAMLIPSIIGITVGFPNMGSEIFIQRMVGGIDIFSLLAIPFFMLAADIMSKGNIGSRLVNFANGLVGHLPGGLAITTVLTCTIFGAISGAGPAAIVAVGLILYPALVDHGYPKGKSIAVIASSSSLAMLIPPGIAMILYGISANVSIGKLFMSGMTIGIIVAIVFAVYVAIDAIKNKIPRKRPSTFKEILKYTKEALWALGLPTLILVGIYGGVMTPTEAAAVAVGYVLIVELLVYKSMTLKELYKIGVTSGRTVAMIFILIGSGSLLAWYFTANQVPQTIIQLTDGAPNFVILIAMNLIFFVAGMFLDPNSIVIVLTPLVYPLALNIGIDPLHLGMMLVLNCAIGMISPPFGLNIFVSMGSFKASFWEVVRPLFIYIILMVVILLFVIFIPEISTFLPNLLLD